MCPHYESTLTDRVGTLFRQGQWYCSNNQIELATSSFLAILQEHQKSPHAMYGLGCILHASGIESRDPNLFVHAGNLFLAASSDATLCGVASFQLGLILERLGDRKLINFFSKAAELLPDCAEAQIKYSRHAFWQEEKITDGLQAFERALKLRPGWLEAYDLTHFEGSYVQGLQNDARLKEHLELKKQRFKEKRRALGVDSIPVRVLRGVDGSLGHYVWFDDIYRLQQLGWLKPYQCMVLPENRVVNPTLMSYWSRHFSINESKETYQALKPLVPYLEFDFEEDLCGPLQKYDNNYYRVINQAQEQWEKEARPPPLELTEEHKEKSWRTLERLGVPRTSWFVALHVRDDGFTGKDAGSSVRNSDIHNFTKAINFITEQGGWVIRLGDPKMVPMPNLPNTIDYARSDVRSDWMDVFLLASCKFFVGTHSGPIWIPKSFGVPTLGVDWVPLTRLPWSGNSLVIPKLFKHKLTQQILTVEEMVDPNGKVGWGWGETALERAGLEVIPNSAEEILEGVREMFQRVAGSFSSGIEEQTLQQRFQEVVYSTAQRGLQGDRTALIPGHFLHKYRGLFA